MGMCGLNAVALRVAGKVVGFMQRSTQTDAEQRAHDDARACEATFKAVMESEVYPDLPWQQRSLVIVREFAVAIYAAPDILFETRVLERWAKPIMLTLLNRSSRGREVVHTPQGPRFLPPQHEART